MNRTGTNEMLLVFKRTMGWTQTGFFVSLRAMALCVQLFLRDNVSWGTCAVESG